MKGFTPTRIPPMRRGAFTLIEVMIVIAIVLALMGLVGYAVMERRDEAKRDLAKIDLNNIRQGLKLFRFDFDRYPTDEEGIKVLWDKSALSADAEAAKWHPYLEAQMPNDRWGQAWHYESAGKHGDATSYDLWSSGPDKQDGNDDDITSWGSAGGSTGGTGANEEAPPPASSGSAPPAGSGGH